MALVIRKDITPYFEIDSERARAVRRPRLQSPPRRAARFIEHFENVDAAARARPRADDDAELPGRGAHPQRDPAPAQGRHRSEDRRGAARARRRSTCSTRSCLPAMKDVGDKFGARRTDPAVRAAVGRSDEEGRRASRAVPGEDRGRRPKDGRAGDGLRRRARHRQEPRQHDPLQQRLHRARPRQASADERDPRESRRGRTPTRSGSRRCWSRPASRCRSACRSRTRAACSFPVIIGGAAINRDFGRRIALLDEGERYFDPGVFYAKDAFEGLEIMDRLVRTARRREAFGATMRAEAERRASATPAATARRRRGAQRRVKRRPSGRRSGAAVLGARERSTISTCATLWPCFDLRASIRLSWGAANTKGEACDAARPRRVRAASRSATSDGADRRSDRAARRLRLFPGRRRRRRRDRLRSRGSDARESRASASPPDRRRALCLADYLREPVDGAASDVIALQVVTVGRVWPAERTEALQARRRLQRIVLPARVLRAVGRSARRIHAPPHPRANWARRRARQALSWGYGACPDLSQHEIVFAPARRANARSASAHRGIQIVPEQSTAAIVIHHPRPRTSTPRRCANSLWLSAAKAGGPRA